MFIFSRKRERYRQRYQDSLNSIFYNERSVRNAVYCALNPLFAFCGNFFDYEYIQPKPFDINRHISGNEASPFLTMRCIKTILSAPVCLILETLMLTCFLPIICIAYTVNGITGSEYTLRAFARMMGIIIITPLAITLDVIAYPCIMALSILAIPFCVLFDFGAYLKNQYQIYSKVCWTDHLDGETNQATSIHMRTLGGDIYAAKINPNLAQQLNQRYDPKICIHNVVASKDGSRPGNPSFINWMLNRDKHKDQLLITKNGADPVKIGNTTANDGDEAMIALDLCYKDCWSIFINGDPPTKGQSNMTPNHQQAGHHP
jgi:hypothetical protein